MNKRNTNTASNTLEAARLLASMSTRHLPSPVPVQTPAHLTCLESNIVSSSDSIIQKPPVTSPVQKDESFPQLMMKIISDPMNDEVIAWLPQGFAFTIKDPEKFNRDITPKLNIGKKKVESELRRWGYKMISSGSSNSVYFHQYFHRDTPLLCNKIRIPLNTKKNEFTKAKAQQKKEIIKTSTKNQFTSIPSIVENDTQGTKKVSDSGADVSKKADAESSTTLSKDEQTQTSPSSDIYEKFNSKSFGNANLTEQRNMILSSISRRRKINEQSFYHIGKQIDPGSDLADINRSFQSFRKFHNLIISRSIDALFDNIEIENKDKTLL